MISFCVRVMDILNHFGNPGLAEDAGALLIHAQKLHHNQVQKRLHTFSRGSPDANAAPLPWHR